MGERPSRVTCDIPFDAPGKHSGTLAVPFSRNASAWGRMLVPIVCVRGGEGPAVLLVAGQHGDEFEGPLVLGELCRALDPAHVRGSVIVLPALNVSGLAECSRLAAVDGRDPNRSYPGERTGSPTQMLCHYIDTALLDRADFVLDLHSGGRSLVFLPSILMHPVADLGARRRTRAALEAFGAPTGVVIDERDLIGALDEQVERRGTPLLFAELGGGARVSPAAVEIGTRGVWSVLAHLGVLSPEHPGARVAGAATERVLDASDAESFVISSEAGVLEPRVELGDEVRGGDVVARLHRVTQPGRAPVALTARRDGVVTALRALAPTEPGDTVMLIAGPETA